MSLEKEVSEAQDERSHIDERLKSIEKELRASNEEKVALTSKINEQNQYIEELLEGVKDRERVADTLETDKDQLTDALTNIRKELEKKNKEIDSYKELNRALNEKLDISKTDTNNLEKELLSVQNELDVAREELRQAKRRVESLRQENGEMEVELKRQLRLVEEGQDRIDDLVAKSDELTKDRMNLQTKLTGTKSELEILRRENERLLISQKDVRLDDKDC